MGSTAVDLDPVSLCTGHGASGWWRLRVFFQGILKGTPYERYGYGVYGLLTAPVLKVFTGYIAHYTSVAAYQHSLLGLCGP